MEKTLILLYLTVTLSDETYMINDGTLIRLFAKFKGYWGFRDISKDVGRGHD